MKVSGLLLLLGLVGGVSAARADVMFSGNVQTSSTQAASCSNSGGPAGFLIGCSSIDREGIYSVTSRAAAHGDALTGSLYAAVDLSTFNETNAQKYARGSASAAVSFDQTYILIGGLGDATVNLDLTAFIPDFSPAGYGCSLSFDGVSQPCSDILGSGAGTISESVEYFVPFTIQFAASTSAFAGTFATPDEIGQLTYQLSGPGLLVPIATPEPSSLLLLLPGLVGTVGVARARQRG